MHTVTTVHLKSDWVYLQAGEYISGRIYIKAKIHI